MQDRKRIETHYLLFKLIYSNIWVKGKEMALALGRSGRGKTISSAFRQLEAMYKSRVSFHPRLVLNNCRGYETTAYFCQKKNSNSLANIYWKLYKMKRTHEISSAFCLLGKYDYFITSRKESPNLRGIGLESVETLQFYDPIYTVPTGWRHPVRRCLRNLFSSEFTKGKLDRKCSKELMWDNVDWRIYQAARGNVRRQFKEMAREVGESVYMVKNRLIRNVIPSCRIAHFFFPNGYAAYQKMFVRLYTEYERSVVNALKKLPCTTYVYPLEDSIALFLFYEDDTRDIFTISKKMQEMGLCEDLLLSMPLGYVV